MKKALLILLAIAATFILSIGIWSCNNGGGDEPQDCPCKTEGVSDQTVQGDAAYCDDRRATGECVHTRECEAKKNTSL